MLASNTHTRDSISLRGAGFVTVVQEKKGARFTLDSLLLADFCRVKSRNRILEPGAGTGVISLLLAKKYPHARIVALEILNSSARICRRNIAENNLEERITLLEQDLTSLKRSSRLPVFDVIVANPPYRKTGSGKLSTIPGRLSSHHDRFGDMAAWLDLHKFLKNRGLYFLVFPSDRLAELISLLHARKLEPKRIRLVHSYRNKPSSIVLVESLKEGNPGLQVMPPLVVHEPGGEYTEEISKIYGPLLR